MAKQVNGPAFERALDEPEPRKLRPSAAFDLATSYWDSSSVMWSGLLERFRLKGELPAFRPLAYNESVEDQEVTGCARLNNDKEVIASSDRALYCPADGKNGTIYWPVKEFEKRWKASELPDEAVTRGLVIQMSQLLGEFLAVRIHETYSGMAAAAEIPLPMQPDITAVGYCFAGTALQGRYLNRDTALAGLALLDLRPESSKEELGRALAFGFDTNSLGKCMVEFWPKAN